MRANKLISFVSIISYFLFPEGYAKEVENVKISPTTVIATRAEKSVFETAGSDSVTTASEIEQLGAGNLGQSLKYEPGVSVPFDSSGTDAYVPYLENGEKSVRIRGIGGNRISIRLDGIRQPEDFSSAGGSSPVGGPGRIFFDPALLSQIEIFKTASSSLYGSDAMGGTIQGQTLGPSTLLGQELSGEYFRNSFSVNSVNHGIHNRLIAAQGEGTFSHSIVHSFREGSERKVKGSVSRNPLDFQSHAILYKGRFSSLNWFSEGTIDVYSQETKSVLDTIAGDFNKSVTHESSRNRDRFSVMAELSEGTDLLFADTLSIMIYSQESSQKSTNTQYRVRNDEIWYRDINYDTMIHGLNFQANKSFDTTWGTNALRYGFETSLSDVSSGYFLTKQLSDGSQIYEDRIGMAPADAFRHGMFIIDEMTIGEKNSWVLTPSLRFQHYKVDPRENAAFLKRASSKGFVAVEYENTIAAAPGLSLLHNLTPDLNVYTSYNHGVRNPSIGELNGYFEHLVSDSNFIIVPNPDLGEETSDSYELGIQFKGESSDFHLAAFQNNYDGFIDLQTVSGPVLNILSNANIGKARIQGVEFSANFLSDQTLTETGSILTGFSACWIEGEEVNSGDPLNTIDPFKGSAYVAFTDESQSWGTKLAFTYRGDKDLSDISQSYGMPMPIDQSAVLDLTGWLKLNDHWEIRGGLFNLTNEHYFLWSDSSRAGGHAGVSHFDHMAQPGVNGFITLTANF